MGKDVEPRRQSNNPIANGEDLVLLTNDLTNLTRPAEELAEEKSAQIARAENAPLNKAALLADVQGVSEYYYTRLSAKLPTPQQELRTVKTIFRREKQKPPKYRIGNKIITYQYPHDDLSVTYGLQYRRDKKRGINQFAGDSSVGFGTIYGERSASLVLSMKDEQIKALRLSWDQESAGTFLRHLEKGDEKTATLKALVEKIHDLSDMFSPKNSRMNAAIIINLPESLYIAYEDYSDYANTQTSAYFTYNAHDDSFDLKTARKKGREMLKEKLEREEFLDIFQGMFSLIPAVDLNKMQAISNA